MLTMKRAQLSLSILSPYETLFLASPTFFRRFLGLVAWHFSAKPFYQPDTTITNDPILPSQWDHKRDHSPSLTTLPPSSLSTSWSVRS
jgi:hypothetical protein